jgi:hypothetical protein
MLNETIIDKHYKPDPVKFVEHALGHFTWSKQREILWSIRDNEKTAVKACHGSSKTFTAAEAVVWWFNVYPENSVVITTAPTHPQVEKLLWKEVNSIYSTTRIGLRGKCLTLGLEDTWQEKKAKEEMRKKIGEKDSKSDKHFAYGFSTDRADRAEGYHAWNMLFIFDEAKGIDQWMWDAAEGAMTAGNVRWLVISTTDGLEQNHPFWKCFGKDSDWNQISISAFDSPFVTEEQLQSYELIDGDWRNFRRVKKPIEELEIQIASKKWIEKRADPLTGWIRLLQNGREP